MILKYRKKSRNFVVLNTTFSKSMFETESTKKKVLFVSSEMAPFLDDSDIANVARIVPQAIQEKDNEIRILVPKFGVINERRNRLHEVVRLSGINITIDDNDNPLIIKVASVPGTKMQVYFLDNDDFFQRKAVYADEDGKFFDDNDERTIFFCKGVIETVKKLGWAPDIIHCSGWMTGLIPFYLKTTYKNEPVFKNAKVVYSLGNCTEMGHLGADFARKASVNNNDEMVAQTYSNADVPCLNKSAAQYADALVTLDESSQTDMAEFLAQKPHMMHDDNSCAEKYVTFYESLMSMS